MRKKRFSHEDRAEAAAFTSTAAAQPPSGKPEPNAETGPDAFQRFVKDVHELRSQVFTLWATRIDGVRLILRRMALFFVLGILGLVVVLAYLVTCTVLVIAGIGEGFGQLFGQLWLGHLVTGLTLLGGLGLATYLGVRRMTRVARERTIQKYAQRSERTSAPSPGRVGDEPHNRDNVRA